MEDEEEPMSTDVMMSFAGEAIAKDIESKINDLGEWDMPATLWDIKMEDMPEGLVEYMAEHRDELKDSIVASGRTETNLDPEFMNVIMGDKEVLGFGMAFMPEIVDYLEGHPYEAMKGKVADPDVMGAVLVTEGWDYSEKVKQEFLEHKKRPPFQPSQDPDRREMRMAHIIWRDGGSAMIQRWRDTDQVESWVNDADKGIKVSGRVVSVLRRYIGLSSGQAYDTAAYKAARICWALAVIQHSQDLHDHMKEAADTGRKVYEELKDTLLSHEMPPEMAEAFCGNPADALALVAIRCHPNDALERTPAGMYGLTAVFEDCPDLPNYDDLKWEDLGLLGGKGPEIGSPEDIALWDKARIRQISITELIHEELDNFFATMGKRDVAGIPAPIAKEKLTDSIEFMKWADAPLYAMECDNKLPSDNWLIERLDKMVEDEVFTDMTADLIKKMAGLEAEPEEDE